MAYGHVKSNTIGDATGTVTVWNSAGSTATAAATDLVRPADWNSAHQFTNQISGNTAGTSSAVGTNLVFGGTNGITLSHSTEAGAATMWISGPGAKINRSYHEIMDGERLTNACAFSGASFSKRPVLVPFWMEGDALGLGTVRVMLSRSAGTSLNATLGCAFYSMNNATSITRYASTTHAVSLTTSAQWSGVRAFDFTGMSASSLSEGRWVMALYVSGSNNSTAVANVIGVGGDAHPVAGFIYPGTDSTAATASNLRMFPFWGVYSVTSAGFPDGIALSQVMGGNSGQAADIYAAIYEGTL